MLCRGFVVYKWYNACKVNVKELEQLKLSKSATVDKFITKKHKEAVSNVEFTVTK